MTPVKRKRLDELLVERELAETVERAQAMILAGEVVVRGIRVDKPGTLFPLGVDIIVKESRRSVGRGATKLEAALKAFSIGVAGKICADVGASTGGFTEVLLRYGAAKVYAIDTAYGELAWKLRSDSRVVVMERTNAVNLTTLPEPIEMAVVDLSFVSLQRIIPVIVRWFGAYQPDIAALFKPQYEALPDELPTGAVIHNAELHRLLLHRFSEWLDSNGFHLAKVLPAPIRGRGGNQEFLVHVTLRR